MNNVFWNVTMCHVVEISPLFRMNLHSPQGWLMFTTTWCYNPMDSTIHYRWHDSLKSHILHDCF